MSYIKPFKGWTREAGPLSFYIMLVTTRANPLSPTHVATPHAPSHIPPAPTHAPPDPPDTRAPCNGFDGAPASKEASSRGPEVRGSPKGVEARGSPKGVGARGSPRGGSPRTAPSSRDPPKEGEKGRTHGDSHRAHLQQGPARFQKPWYTQTTSSRVSGSEVVSGAASA